MKVKIGEMIFDSNIEPIMLILEEGDKINIAAMGEQKKYCSFPEFLNEEEIIDFMKD